MSTPPPSPAPAAPRSFEWWTPFVALISAYGAAIVFVAILAGATGNGGGDLPPAITLTATFVQDGLLIAAMLAFATLTGVRVTAGTFGLRRVQPRRVLPAAIVAFAVFYGFLLAWAQIQPETKDDLLDDLGAKGSTSAAVAVAVLVLIVAPIVEELFFRGFLFPALGRVMGWLPAALLAGGIFGGIHAGGTPAIFLVPLAVLGFVLCVLYRRTGSVLPGMGVHAFNNALTLGIGLSWSLPGVLAVLVIAPVLVIVLVSRFAE